MTRPWSLEPRGAAARARARVALGSAALAALLALPGCSSAGQDGAAPSAREGVVTSPSDERAAPATGGGLVSPAEGGPRVERVPESDEAVPARGDADTRAVPADLLAAARADLERRLAAEKATGPIRVLIAQAVTWSDGALGCPQPGMNYTMALVPGYRVVFGVRDGAAERRYAYHSGRTGPLAYCANPAPPAAGSSAI